MNEPSQELFDAMKAAPRQVDKAQAQQLAREFWSQRQVVSELEERLREAKQALEKLQHEIIPDALDQIGLDKLGVPPNGNEPGFDLVLSPYHRASIPSDWPEERRKAAFKALTDLGHEDLIKTEITIFLPRDQRSVFQAIIRALKPFGANPVVKESVHWKTLTSWLKEQISKRKPIPPLDVIGATVGRIATIKERKE